MQLISLIATGQQWLKFKIFMIEPGVNISQKYISCRNISPGSHRETRNRTTPCIDCCKMLRFLKKNLS